VDWVVHSLALAVGPGSAFDVYPNPLEVYSDDFSCDSFEVSSHYQHGISTSYREPLYS